MRRSCSLALVVHLGAVVLLVDEVHLVDEAEDVRRGLQAVLAQRVHAGLELLHVLLAVGRLDVEDVDQHLHVAEDGVLLRLEVVVHEGVLAAAVPQRQDEVAQEADVRVLDAQGRAQAHRVARKVVGEDDRAHRRLAAAALPHQQHLSLH